MGRALLWGVLDKMSVLLFCMQEGWREAHSAYSRLAMWEAMLKKMAHNRAPGVDLAIADLCRSLVCACFVQNGAAALQRQHRAHKGSE